VNDTAFDTNGHSKRSQWSGENAVVTGGGGFIGSHLVEQLVREGANVTAFIKYSSRGDLGNLNSLSPDVRSAIRVVAGDLRDHRAVADVVRGADTVFHLGALVGIPYSYVNPVEVAEVNTFGTLNVLNAARDANVKRLVHTSTSEVYGTALYVPIDEAHPLQGQSPYSASKIGADKLAESYQKSFGLPVTTVRPFNTYGPRQSSRGVIPTVISQALAGDTIRIGSLEPTRDFTFVTDTVAGFLSTAAEPACIGEVVNLGTGSEVSVGTIVNQVRALVGTHLEVVQEPERFRPAKSEVMRLVSDNRKARRLAGWSPQISLAEGLARTIEWMSQHVDRERAHAYAI